MTEMEWLEIGYSKNIIAPCEGEEITFKDAYLAWFCMKAKCVKGQSLDRIECTYNRYFAKSLIVETYISTFTESIIVDFLLSCITESGNMNYKEFSRILQVVRSPLLYMRDMEKGCAPLLDWEKIKRNLPINKLESAQKYEFAVSMYHVEQMLDAVINRNIYPVKHNACLLLCMNFYLGLRIGELAALGFSDFDFERNVIKIYKTETKCFSRSEDGSRLGVMVYRVVDDLKTVYSVREIPILPEVKMIYERILKNHLNNRYDSPYLGYDGTDTILVRSLDRTLRKLCQLCDVPYFHSHDIRKTFATMLHFHGVPTRVISDLLGHSEIATTENSYILSYNNNYQQIYAQMHESLKYNIALK